MNKRDEGEKLWHVLYTLPRKEKRVNCFLKESNISSLLPTQFVVRQWSDRKKKIEIPLFSNYVFVKIKPSDKWNILKIPGVVRFVGSRTEDCVVPESEMEALIRMVKCETAGVDHYRYEEGEECIVNWGPLQGIRGTFVKRNGRNSLILQVKSIQRSVIVDINPAYVSRFG